MKMSVIEKPTLKMGFLIFPDFPMACLTSMIEPLRAANEISGRTAFSWQVIGESHEIVTASAKVDFKPDLALREVEALDYLFIMSAPNSYFKDPKNGNGCLRKLAMHGVNLGAISGGVFPMARAKLLSGFTASVHWCYRTAFEIEFPDIDVVDDVIFVDGARLTISGAAAGFDMMLRLIEAQLDSAIMTEVACWFQHPFVRGEGVVQRVPTPQGSTTSDMLPAKIHKAIQLFSENFDDPISVTEVAEIVGLSNRQFERKFKQLTGHSPVQYYRLQRMKAAKQLVMYSSKSITEITAEVGYSSRGAFISYYKEIYGIEPKEEREKVNMFRVNQAAALPSI